MVTLIQRFGRFGCAIYLNLHLHKVALDGFYTREGKSPRFHDLSAPSGAGTLRLLDAIVSRMLRCLEHDGLLIRDHEQPWLDHESRDALDALGAASIQYGTALGPHAGLEALSSKLAAPKSPSAVPRPFTVVRGGCSLNTAVAFAAHERAGIGRLCRYFPGPCAGPALALERLRTDGAGQVIYPLKVPYRGSTSHCVFEALEFITHLHVRGRGQPSAGQIGLPDDLSWPGLPRRCHGFASAAWRPCSATGSRRDAGDLLHRA